MLTCRFHAQSYKSEDALFAADILANNNTFEHGTYIEENSCIYHNHESTIVSLCNGSGRNRTVHRGEVRRGIDQLIKDCSIDEGPFSGVHVVNNLTFAAYGIFGGKNIKVPAGANPPDTPGGAKRGHMERSLPPPFVRSRYTAHPSPSLLSPSGPFGKRQIDPCAAMGYDGNPKYNCPQKPEHTLRKDGTCPAPVYSSNCWAYCEIKRTGYLGLETVLSGQAQTQNLPAISVALQSGAEYTVSNGFSVGVEGILKEVFALSVNYACKSLPPLLKLQSLN